MTAMREEIRLPLPDGRVLIMTPNEFETFRTRNKEALLRGMTYRRGPPRVVFEGYLDEDTGEPRTGFRLAGEGEAPTG